MICVHRYETSDKLGYLKCSLCGTYTSTADVEPRAVYTPDYWTHERGHSTLEEQVYNCDTHKENLKSKYEFTLEAIHTPRCAALEIGCAPGRFLQILKGIGQFTRVVGIETCPEYEESIRKIGCFGGELLFGFFPDCTDGLAGGQFDLITGLDVFEHSPEPVDFLRECRRLLRKNAQLLLMAPLAYADLEERFYAPEEHIYLHSEQHLIQMLYATGFAGINIERWCNGHELISARRT